VNTADTQIPVSQVATVVRIDLTDPDVHFLATPRTTNYLEGTRETSAMSISRYLSKYQLQLAINANFYSTAISIDPPEGTPMDVFGLLVSQGLVVSPTKADVYRASILFSTNNQPLIVFTNTVPGTNNPGIYTAVSGNYPLLRNGQNIAPPTDTRTARNGFGLSQDRRYLYMLTIDSVASDSDGANFSEVASWLRFVGAYDAINLDGGGSTTLDTLDCYGEVLQLNRSFSKPERNVASHFGVYASPLPSFISNVEIVPFNTTATVRWQTAAPASAQVEYGPTISYGSFSASNSIPLTNHVATLNGLLPHTLQRFLILVTAGSNTYSLPCYFTTTSFLDATVRVPIFGLTNSWKYTTNNLDGVRWQAPSYDDSGWLGPAPALFYIEDNSAVLPKGTGLPPTGGTVTGAPGSPTYYFRTHFTFYDDPWETIFYLTNYIDDGAVFYLNGTEIARIRVPAAPSMISYRSLALTAPPCGGFDASCPDVLTISGALKTNLFLGDNVLAVELHQANNQATDAVFGSALSYNPTVAPRANLQILTEGPTTTLFWNGIGFVLQHADDPAGPWTDIAPPVSTSPWILTGAAGTSFFRLHRPY
jgi:hypothetical protein